MLPEGRPRVRPGTALVYHRAMDQASQEVEELGERVERILATVRRLAEENESLRTQLAATHDANRHLEQRIAEARERVQAALAHLPAAAHGPDEAASQDAEGGPTPAHEHETESASSGHHE